jgi:hypothetical protein
MNAAGMLKRSVMIGLAVTALTISGTFLQPTAPALASVLPHSDVGSPDVGYPCPGGCQFQMLPPSSGDIGYPSGGCGGACGPMRLTSPAPSGDIGYPCMSCRTDFHPASPAPSGDVGYPQGCPSCSVLSQSDSQSEDVAAWN